MGSLRERNLVYDHGSEVLARCRAWQGAYEHLPACFPTCTAGWDKSRRRDCRVCRGVGAYACLATVERRSARKKYDCLQFSRRCALVLS